MSTTSQIEHRRLESELERLNRQDYVGSAASAFAARLDVLLPPQTISTHEAAKTRLIPDKDGNAIHPDPDSFPYLEGIENACDMEGVEAVAVQGGARTGKTFTAEGHAFKRWKYGPAGNMLWYMQSEDEIDDYIEERGEFILQRNPEIAEKINWSDRRNARARKRIGGSLARWLPATMRTTRGKAAPFIVADEIDAYPKKIRNAVLTLLRNRQREFGSAALLYLASHPDAGVEGIAGIIAQGIRHLWWWRCLHCDKPSSPAAEATTRMTWNVSELLAQAEGLEKDQILDLVAREATLICPHCKGTITNEERLTMSRQTGRWLQPGQEMMDDGEIAGEHRVEKIMGFVIHAFMSSIVRVGDLAKEFVGAQMAAEETQNDQQLREVTVKSLGEVYAGAKPEEVLEDWKVIQTRLGAAAGVYARGTVPPGVRFITAFADTHGYGWEVRVIGWGHNLESWLIDAYPLRDASRIPGFDGREFAVLKPATRLADWGMLEYGVVDRMFPLADRPGYFLPVAKLMVDDNGEPGVSNMARVWLAGLKDRGVTLGGKPFPPYRVQLQVGSAHTGGELYGTPKLVLKDDQGKQLPTSVTVLAPDVTSIKKIIARRMKIENPAEGGRMHIPSDIPDGYVRQLESERLTNGKWYRFRANETWDGWVACEVARAWLWPDNVIWNPEHPDYDLPEWARPVQIGPVSHVEGAPAPQPISQWEKIAAMNAGINEG